MATTYEELSEEVARKGDSHVCDILSDGNRIIANRTYPVLDDTLLHILRPLLLNVLALNSDATPASIFQLSIPAMSESTPTPSTKVQDPSSHVR